MSATLKLTHKAIGVEVRRGAYDAVVDGERVASVEMNDTIEIPIEAGHHTLQVRNGRNLSRTLSFDATEGRSSPSDAPERGSCRSFSCRSSYHAWRFRSVRGSRGSQNRTVPTPLILESTCANRRYAHVRAAERGRCH
jgi:hypothetical protein